VRIHEEDQCVLVLQDMQETHTFDALEEHVYPMLNVLIMRHVKTTTVLTHVQHLADEELIVGLKIMWLFADVQEVTPEILSKDVESSLEMKFVKLVELIPIAKLVKTILQFVNVNKIMSEIPFKDVDVNVNLQETVLNPKNVKDSNAYQYVEKEFVVKMPTVKPEITELNVHAHLISLVTDTLDATLNVQNTTIALETKPVLNSNVETHAENQIQMYADKEQTAKSKIISQFAHVQEDTPVIHSEAAVSLPEKIFVNLTHVEMEPNASLAMIVVALTDQSAHVHQEQEGTH